MDRKSPTTSLAVALILTFLFLPGYTQAQERMPVKLTVQSAPGDWIGQRLATLITQGITSSDTLRAAREGDTPLLICNLMTVKVKGRPVSAYSYILFSNNRGKISPVLGHYLGLCSNLTVKDAARTILGVLQKTALKVTNP